jgi:CheY-like chemotaxis protein
VLAADPSGVELRVRDTGRGIPAKLLPHVFERFQQGDGAAVREHGGLGLGLAIARHLVEAHGGTIRAESEGEQRGATFVVRMPIVDAGPPGLRVIDGASARDARDRAGKRLAGATLLLVEDHVDTRDAIEHLLRTQGAHVLVAGNVADALAQVESERPSLVISDLGLPHESGYRLIERLRSLDGERGVHTPAIAASGFASGEDRKAALAAGFDAYLSKPVDLTLLLAQIASLLAR